MGSRTRGQKNEGWGTQRTRDRVGQTEGDRGNDGVGREERRIGDIEDLDYRRPTTRVLRKISDISDNPTLKQLPINVSLLLCAIFGMAL